MTAARGRTEIVDMSLPPTKCTLYPVFAAASPHAVIYRRGPSNHTCLIAWDRSDDSFEIGHWFKGTVKPAWSGLSPDGEWLVSFVGKYRGPFATWTVLSRPPFLTAVALWPKGDTWAGGGFFLADGTLVLTHGEGPYDLAPGFSPPPGLTVLPFTRANAQALTARAQSGPAASRWRPDPAVEGGWILDAPSGAPSSHAFIRSVSAYTADPLRSLPESVRHSLCAGGPPVPLPVAGWAAFDRNGDLLFSQGGALFRLDADRIAGLGSTDELLARARCLADFSDLRFRPLAAPYAAPKDGFAPALDRVSREDRQWRRQMRKARERVGGAG
ncbi:hypothetical protein MPPM_1195 [Methylorubrum populi]|uniref:Uncharacterized protein n=2 Tax=Methylorubrum populi TaxID=223967 RepID=A0A160PEP9_9HYPH|nr:hypothetical protein MPPM_1195 [Methylorubrum populi]